MIRLIDRVKNTDAPVFILGESGTGKEMVARQIHFTGRRGRGPFMAVNCGAIPEHLLESEMFGFSRGAFSGAVRDKPGLVEEASGGTLFLDEIGDLPLTLQAKLLRLLEEKEVRRVGDIRSRPIDVRYVCATNKVIEEEVAEGRFREDLYYRLRIVTISLPPLRERREDIYPLAAHFLSRYGQQFKRKAGLTPRALEVLVGYAWPGNVRELQNEIQRALILSEGSGDICVDELSSRIRPREMPTQCQPYHFLKARAEFEKRFLNQALSRCNYNRARTAQAIGISRQGLFKLIKKHGIAVPGRGLREEPD